MYKIGNVMIRQTWRSAREFFNKRLFVLTPLSSARALEVCRLDDRVVKSASRKSRFLSSSVAEEDDVNPFSLISNDMENIYNRLMAALRNKITNSEMYDIAINYHHNALKDNLGSTAAIAILFSKILNYHRYKDGTLTDAQRNVISILELIFIQAVLHDDILDSADDRHGAPAAHKLWLPYKVIITGNMVLGIACSEASKLSNYVYPIIFEMHQLFQKGHMMDYREVIDGDLLGHHLISQSHKKGIIVKYVAYAIARAVKANDSLINTMSQLGYNLGMCFGFIDDIQDFDEDLRCGNMSAPVVFATREYPELKEMIMRNFTEEGDKERTIELVNKSQGFEESRAYARMYHRFAMDYLHLLADSPYKEALKTIVELALTRIEPEAGKNFMVDF